MRICLDLITILCGYCFMVCFCMFYEMLVEEIKEHHKEVLFYGIYHLIFFVGNFYLFLKYEGNVFLLFVGFVIGWYFSKLCLNLCQKKNFIFIKIMNTSLLIATIALAYFVL